MNQCFVGLGHFGACYLACYTFLFWDCEEPSNPSEDIINHFLNVRVLLVPILLTNLYSLDRSFHTNLSQFLSTYSSIILKNMNENR